MATVQDLRAITDQLRQNDAALSTEIGVLTGAVHNLVGEFDRIKGQLSPADQSMLDQVVQDLTDAAASLATETQNLSTEQQEVDAANPPAPTPEPAPGV